jgi:hypothetical protein
VIQISAEGGSVPKWSADGKELFFRGADGTLRVAAIETSNGAFRPAASVTVGPLPSNGWSLDRKAQRFLVAMPLDQGAQTPITVVTNWEATLKRN